MGTTMSETITQEDITQQDITPQQATKLANYNETLTAKERQKILALTLPRSCSNALETKICWEFSMYIIKHLWNQDIGPFDPLFIQNVTQNPAAYRDYI
jgi:hypothetical protein